MDMKQVTRLFFVAIALLILMWFTFLAGIFFGIEAITQLLPPSFVIPMFFLSFILIIILMGLYYGITPARVKISHLLNQWEYRKKEWGLKTDTHFDKAEGEMILMPATPSVIDARKFFSASTFPRSIIVTNKRILVGFLIMGARETFQSGTMQSPLSLWHPEIREIPHIPGKPSVFDFLGKNVNITEAKFHEVLTKQDDKDWDSVEFRAKFWVLPVTYRIYSPKAREIYKIFSSPIEE